VDQSRERQEPGFRAEGLGLRFRGECIRIWGLKFRVEGLDGALNVVVGVNVGVGLGSGLRE